MGPPTDMAARRILFDTQLLIWAAGAHPELSAAARTLLLDPEITPVFSVASIWEVTIKSALGRPDFTIDAAALDAGLRGAGYETLPIEARHALAVARLPSPGPGGHRDPFDRLLLAQAREEGIALATADRTLPLYGGDILTV